MKLPLLKTLGAALGIFAVTQVQAAEIQVTVPLNNGPGTLRNAIAVASPNDTITFNPLLNGQVIRLQGRITIDKNLTIIGNGVNATIINGSAVDRIFNIEGSDVEINRLRLESGTVLTQGGLISATASGLSFNEVTFRNGVAGGPAANQGGGAIYMNEGTLEISNGVFDNNNATGLSGSGGAILLIGDIGTTISNTSFDGGSASRAGGAIEMNSNEGNALAVTDCQFTGNSTAAAPGNGGAVHITGNVSSDFINCVFTGNTASSEGGALWNGSGSMQVVNCVLDGNTASGVGADQGGGAIYNLSGIVNVSQGSMLMNNSANGTAGSGGAILNDIGAKLTVQNSTFRNNTSMRAGGAIEDNSRDTFIVSIVGSIFDGNITAAAPGNGGAIHITGTGNMEIATSVFTNNLASAEGGAVWNGLGVMTINDSEFTGNQAQGDLADQGAGALYNLGGEVLVANSIFNNNEATGLAGSGGAILNDANGIMEIIGSTFTGNESNRAGGAIEDNSGVGSVTITESEFTGNTTGSAPGNGGAFHITGGGNAIINGSTFAMNTASAEGGALWNGRGNMTVDGCSFTMNTASGPGADQGGGAIYLLFNGSATVSNSSFEGNTANGASGSGGAILVDTSATLSVVSSTFIDNSSRRAGGAIEDNSRTSNIILIDNSTFTGNSTAMMPGNGGAIHITGPGFMDIVASEFDSNVASAEGGAVWNGLGVMNITNSDFNANAANGTGADQGGGAVYNLGGDVFITGGTFSNNSANAGSGSGGAILNDVNGDLSVLDAVFTGNSSNRAGGAIEDNSGASTTVLIDGAEFMMNNTGITPGNGGAIHITGAGNMDIVDATFNGNSANSEGGGFWNGTGESSVTNCQFINNIASGFDPDQGGGAIYNLGGALAIADCNFSGNIADGAAGSGGAILNDNAGALVVSTSSFSGNTAVRAGGAIEDRSTEDAITRIAESTFTSNETGASPGNGGAIHITGSTDMEIRSCAFTGNRAAAEGGAVWNGAGDMLVDDTEFTDNRAAGNDADQGGGALYNLPEGQLTITASTFTENRATGTAGSGGAILTDLNTSLNVSNCVFDGNSSNRAGGAIEDNTQSAEIILISNSTFVNNETGSTPGNGGAIHITGPGNMNITNSLAENNSAAREGGAFWNGSGTMNISGTKMLLNTASGTGEDDGGGSVWNNGGTININRSSISSSFANGPSGKGGGIYNQGGTLRVENSTISGNIANEAGGGIYNQGAIVLIQNTIAFNNGGATGGGVLFDDVSTQTNITSNIITNNVSDDNQDVSAGTQITSNDFNIIGVDDDMVVIAADNDVVGNTTNPADANLATLADNGGTTLTHAFAGPSIAIDASNPDYSMNDQIGQGIAGGTRDIGAFECQTGCETVDPNAIAEINGTVTAYPNPISNGALTVELEGESVVQIMALDGKILFQAVQNGTTQINMNQFSAGQYQLVVIDNSGTRVSQIMKL